MQARRGKRHKLDGSSESEARGFDLGDMAATKPALGKAKRATGYGGDLFQRIFALRNFVAADVVGRGAKIAMAEGVAANLEACAEALDLAGIKKFLCCRFEWGYRTLLPGRI